MSKVVTYIQKPKLSNGYQKSYRVLCCGVDQPAEKLGEGQLLDIWFTCDECEESLFLSENDFEESN